MVLRVNKACSNCDPPWLLANVLCSAAKDNAAPEVVVAVDEGADRPPTYVR